MHAAPGAIDENDRMMAALEMLQYANGVAEEKRANPGDDLATVLVNSVVDGEQLSDAEFNLFFLLLVNAGGDTTRNLLAGGMQALFEFPGERERLTGDLDGLLPTAFEEMLRWVSPVIYMRRSATRDAAIGEQAIRAGDKVVLYYGSANRDASAFKDPDTFDVGRTPNDHLAFGGGGPHFCLGAHVARVEIQAMLRQILTRLPDIAPAGEPTWQDSNFIYGPKTMPVRFTPGARA
jgi:cytochrome P450